MTTFAVLWDILLSGSRHKPNVPDLQSAIEIATEHGGGSYMSMVMDEQTNEVVAVVIDGVVFKPEK